MAEKVNDPCLKMISFIYLELLGDTGVKLVVDPNGEIWRVDYYFVSPKVGQLFRSKSFKGIVLRLGVFHGLAFMAAPREAMFINCYCSEVLMLLCIFRQTYDFAHLISYLF